MKSSIIVNPISNVANPDEELVLALAAHLEPALANWRAGQDLKKDIDDLEALLPDLNEQAEKLEKSINDLSKKIDFAYKDFKSLPLMLIIVGVIVGGALFFLGYGLIGLGVGVGVIGLGLFNLK